MGKAPVTVTNPRIAKLIELEAEGRIKPEHQQELNAYRAQNLAPPKPKGQINPVAKLSDDIGKFKSIAEAVNLAKENINGASTGFGGSILGNVPGSSGRALRSYIDTLKSNLAFDELAKMRASSPTGGSVGSASDADMRLLSSTVASLDPGLDGKTLAANLDKVSDHYRAYIRSLGYTDDQLTAANGGKPIAGLTLTAPIASPPAAGAPPSPASIAPPTGPAAPSGGGISPLFKALNDTGGAITNDQGKPIISPDFTSTVDTAAKERNGRLLAMVEAGEPDDKVLAAASAAGVDPGASGLNSILAYRNKTGLRKFADTTDYNVRRPTTTGERIVNTIVANPVSTFAEEAGNAAGAGIPQALAKGIGGDNVRANLDALHNTNPIATVGGQLVGTALGAAGGETLAGRGLLRIGVPAERAAVLAPRVGDATFGAVSGATSNPEAPVTGALLGSAAALGGGEIGRGIAAGVAGGLAPTGGNAAPLYAAGIRPSLGQRVVNGGAEGSLKRGIGTIINGTEEAAQSLPGVGFFIKGTRQRARNQFQTGGFNEALSDIGLTLPPDAQRGSAAFRFMDEAHSNAYDDVLPRMTAVADPQAIAETQAITARVRNGGLTGDSAERFDRLIENNVTRRMTGPNLSGPNLQSALSDLGKQIRALRSSPSGDRELADALDDYSQVIRDSAARNSAPEDAARLEDINRSYAKGVALANAAARAGGDTAEFSPTQLLRSSQQVTGGTRSRPFLRGEGLLQDYAEAGRSLVDRLPNSGTADRMLTGQALVGGGSGLLGAVNPTTAAAAGVLTLPYAPIVRNASTALLAPRNSARLNTLGNLIRSNTQIPGALGAGEALALPSQYGN